MAVSSLRKDRDMINNVDNRVLGRKGARMLSNEEMQVVAAGTLKISHLPNGEVDVLGDV
jgi:hypothetical protein